MKLNTKELSERMNISSWVFYEPLQATELNEMDIADHVLQVEAVYKGMLHEVSVYDDCRRIFERTFKRRDFFII